MNTVIVWVLMAIGPGIAQPLDLAEFTSPQGCEALQVQLELVQDNNRRYDCAAYIINEEEDHASN